MKVKMQPSILKVGTKGEVLGKEVRGELSFVKAGITMVRQVALVRLAF